MSAKPTPLFSGRFDHSLDEFDTDLDFKAPPVQTEDSTVKTAIRVGQTWDDEDKDLVRILMEGNKDLWERLLKNKFCKRMKGAAKTDQGFQKSFEWYMKQGYFYIANDIRLRTSRLPKAKTRKNNVTALKRIASAVATTEGFFAMLINKPPGGLGMDPEDILGTPLSQALKGYIELIDSTAEENWVISQVVMIACYQSYYTIAGDLFINLDDHDTPWYKFWVEVNVAYGTSCLRQRKFFIDHYKDWKNDLPKIKDIFEKTCKAELALWDEADNQIPRRPIEGYHKKIQARPLEGVSLPAHEKRSRQ